MSAERPMTASPRTAGRTWVIPATKVHSQNDHPWLSKYMQQQNTWFKPKTLSEFTSNYHSARIAAAQEWALKNSRQVKMRARVFGDDGKVHDFDSDHYADMTQNDWEHVVADVLKKKPRSVVRKIFASADENNSGLLDRFEFMEALKLLGAIVPEEAAGIMFDKIDTDSSGTIDLDEMIKECSAPKGVRLTKKQKQTMASIQWMDPNELFDKWDTNFDGRISNLEIREGLRAMGLPTEMANALIKDLDTNEDDDIDREEWQSQFYKSSLVMQKQPDVEDFTDLHHRRKGCSIPEVEHRAITVIQLGELVGHIKRRCSPEGWKNVLGNTLKYDQVTLYDATRYVIRPATYKRMCSYVELVAQDEQRPRWFVSHWWGEPVADFFACLDTHCSDRDFSRVEVPYWVCAYANNQWKLSEELSDDPAKSSFARAMHNCEGTIAIVDKNANIFTRVWCGFEAFSSFTKDGKEDTEKKQDRLQAYLFDFYTVLADRNEGAMPAKRKRAVGITDGVVKSDGRGALGAKQKEQREKDFPLELAERALSFKIEKAAASIENDRVRILNHICCKKKLNSPVESRHVKFDALNGTLAARFASGALPSAFAARREKPFLEALKTGYTRNLLMNFEGVASFNTIASRKLAESLPKGLQCLQLNLNAFGDAFLGGVDFQRLTGLTTLHLKRNGISEVGVRVIIEEGFHALRLNNLVSLDLSDNKISDEPMIELFQATENHKTLIDINVEDNPCQEFVLEAVTEKMSNCGVLEFLGTINARKELDQSIRESMRPMTGKVIKA